MNDGAAIPSPDGDRRAVVMSGPGLLELCTARLRMAPVAEHELEELLALHADPRAFAEDLTEPLTDRAQMRWVLERWRATWAEHGLGYLSVRALRPADGVGADSADASEEHSSGTPPHDGSVPLPAGLLGVVGLTPLDLGDRTVLSAYWRLAPAATGHGVASEAMQEVLAHPQLGGRSDAGAGAGAGKCDGESSSSEIVAVTAAGNRPSRALAARLGFTPAPPEQPVPGGRAGDVLLVRRGS